MEDLRLETDPGGLCRTDNRRPKIQDRPTSSTLPGWATPRLTALFVGPWPSRRLFGLVAALVVTSMSALPLRAGMDRSRYVPTDEIRPGMKGFGRTVMSGTRIETFQFEVIDVLENAFYAKQDVILVRCSGLDLERSGVIAGMSGSPCYIKDEATGKERMVGAVAYSLGIFTHDAICGLQPISQMLPITQVRDPAKRSTKTDTQPAETPAKSTTPKLGIGIPIGQLIAASRSEPIDESSRFSIFNEEIKKASPRPTAATPAADQLRPLKTPVMISGANSRTIAVLQGHFDRLGLQPVASGGPSPAVREQADEVKLEPGSALCIPLMSGDINMEAFGTCTEVDNGRVLGFGHSLFGQGAVELPMATGHVHMVVSSMYRSTKVGAALRPVGTLWGDEAAGIFGTYGQSPLRAPMDVTIRDIHGQRDYHYELINNEILTAILLQIGVLESVYAHSEPPLEHTVRYTIEMEFENMGTFRGTGFTSQQGVFGLMADVVVPAMTVMNTPFRKARIRRIHIEASIEEGTRVGQIIQASIPRQTYKPGETVTVRVRWFHPRGKPRFTEKSYSIALPDDLPDGSYKLTIGSAKMHLSTLRSEKRHLFVVETLSEVLDALNLIGSIEQNRVYLHLQLPDTGLAIKKRELPNLPSFRAKIYSDAQRYDVRPFTTSQVAEYETDFVVQGDHMFTLKVDRKMNQ